MQKSVIRILWMSTIVGVLLFVIAGSNGYSTYQLKKNGVRTTGIIIALESHDGDNYYPVVRFTTKEGEKITFKSSLGSSFARDTQGTEVEVLYWPENPKKAQIAGYSTAGFLVVVGAVFFFTGAAPLLAVLHFKKKKAHVLHQGRPITALITGVRVFGSANAMGCSPYHIVCKWHDPSADKIHVFESEDIYFDPKPYIHRQQITVYINDNNMKNYYVDISFLPELV